MCQVCKASALGIERLAELDVAEKDCQRLQVNPAIGGFIVRHAYRGRTPHISPEQQAALVRYNTAMANMKDLHHDYVFEQGMKAAQERLSRLKQPDYLMEYANALERNDQEGSAAILKMAETDKGLMAAIDLLHTRCDTYGDRSLPEQILALRTHATEEW